MNLCTKLHGYPFKNCQDFPFKTTNVNLTMSTNVAPEEKSKGSPVKGQIRVQKQMQQGYKNLYCHFTTVTGQYGQKTVDIDN